MTALKPTGNATVSTARRSLDIAAWATGSQRRFLSPGRIGLYAFLIISALYFAVPLYVMVVTSLKTMDEIRQGDLLALPNALDFSAWVRAWSSACTGLTCEGIQVGFWNSIRILVPSLVLSIFLSALTGYALAMWRIPRAGLILGLLMVGGFIPYQVVLYPLVQIVSNMGLYSSLPGIVLIHIVFGLPILTLIFRNYYASMPPELIRAARVDGGGFFTIFFRIALPMSKSILVVALILQMTGIWNDFLLGLIFAGRENLPMTVQLNNLVNTTFGEREYNVNMAATMLTAIPPLVVYFLSGRYFVRGIMAGAVKG